MMGKRYKIDIIVYQIVVQTLETDDFRKAQRFYQHHTCMGSCYPQVYVEGEPLNIRKADKLFYSDSYRAAFYEGATLSKIVERKKGKRK